MRKIKLHIINMTTYKNSELPIICFGRKIFYPFDLRKLEDSIILDGSSTINISYLTPSFPDDKQLLRIKKKHNLKD